MRGGGDRGRPPCGARPTVILVLLSLAVLLAGCGGPLPRGGAGGDGPGAAGLPDGETTRVADVTDGDTIEVGGGRRVRLIGVDTPETKHPDKGVQCYGREASAYTARLLPRGTRVRLVTDVEERDRYDRLLAYVYRVSDGLFVNAALARDGYARPLTIPPNVAHTEEFTSLAARARDRGRGLWGACP
jgi:micrococcal nuclease